MKFFTTNKKIQTQINLFEKDNIAQNESLSYLKFDYTEIKSKKTKTKLKLLQQFVYPEKAVAKLKEKFPFNLMDEEEITICINEFKKYIGLIIIRRYERDTFYRYSDSSVVMTSEIIDEVWHTFIMFTREYHEFSASLFGEFLHHTPADTTSPITDQEIKLFILSYKKYYGSINSIWYYKINKDKKNSSPIDNSNTLKSDSKDSSDPPIINIPILSNNMKWNQIGNVQKEKLGDIMERDILYFLTLNSIIYTTENSMPADSTNSDNFAFAYSENNSNNDSGSADGDGGGGGCGG